MKITWQMVALVKRVMFAQENKLFSDMDCKAIIEDALSRRERQRLTLRLESEKNNEPVL